ncbi:MAG: outer membrane beta-barrel protein [Bacteroidota bacterium]
MKLNINKKQTLFYIALLLPVTIYAQKDNSARYYVGVSYGRSLAVGDFKDNDLSNPDAGFAENGNKFDVYFGFQYQPRITLTGAFRFQNFDADISNIQSELEAINPDETFSSNTENWKVYYALVGFEYQVNITKKMDIFPKFGLGPMFITTPGFEIASSSQFISRSSETGSGLGYEFGIGLKTDLGRHLALMPSFTFSGGIATIEQTTNTNNVIAVADFQPKVTTFNLGLSFAYKF